MPAWAWFHSLRRFGLPHTLTYLTETQPVGYAGGVAAVTAIVALCGYGTLLAYGAYAGACCQCYKGCHMKRDHSEAPPSPCLISSSPLTLLAEG